MFNMTLRQLVAKYKIGFVVAVIVIPMLVTACDNNSAVTGEQRAVNTLQQYAQNKIPTPVMKNFLERYLMNELYLARDNAVSTWSYIQSPYTGKILWMCQSIGFPIPGGTQLTNPSQYYLNGGVLPQAEPNSLYSPETSAGTYVMCVNDDGTISPVYKEPNVETSMCPIAEVDGRVDCVKGAQPSLKIDINKNPAKGTPGFDPNANPDSGTGR